MESLYLLAYPAGPPRITVTAADYPNARGPPEVDTGSCFQSLRARPLNCGGEALRR